MVGVETYYIEPGSPWENGYAESFHSRLRDELLEREEFTTLLEARVVSAAWRIDYDQERPHSALNYQTPAEFASSCPRKGEGESAKPGEKMRKVEAVKKG